MGIPHLSTDGTCSLQLNGDHLNLDHIFNTGKMAWPLFFKEDYLKSILIDVLFHQKIHLLNLKYFL